jgi:hypothetical protein
MNDESHGPDQRLDGVEDGRMPHQFGHERQSQMRLRHVVQPAAPKLAVLHALAQCVCIGLGDDAHRKQHTLLLVARNRSVRQTDGQDALRLAASF